MLHCKRALTIVLVALATDLNTAWDGDTAVAACESWCDVTSSQHADWCSAYQTVDSKDLGSLHRVRVMHHA